VTPEQDEWFEHAIDCCAFLAWSLSNQGAAIHFRSNGYQFRQPEDGDIYAILKYLALVYPQASAPEPPMEETSYKIVFTASPQRFLDAGWMGARVIGVEATTDVKEAVPLQFAVQSADKQIGVRVRGASHEAC
jgi:hypothetical protein